MSELIGTWIAATLTIAILSFLDRDNPFYKFAEHLYVGISAGFFFIYFWASEVKPMLIDSFMDNIAKSNYIEAFILFIPALLGVLMITRWFPRTSWLSRLPIAFTVGIGAGLGITVSIQGFLLPQIKATLIPVVTINAFLIILAVITTLLYFYFSKEHKGIIGVGSKIGIIFIMVAFGASFGYTVMARISLLIGRIYFLLHNWLGIIK